MDITIIVVGKIKEHYYEKAIAEYIREIRKQCNINIVEVMDEKAPENMSELSSQEVKNKEGKRIIQKLDVSSHVIILEINGDMKSTKGLAKVMKANSHKPITFIIGGSIGLSDEVIKKAHDKISFSRMTFPHQLMRVILLEQINRCVSLTYDKGDCS
jgi:23S rRNA (pseudouridine1915-N3)-methyltransferase